MAPTPPPLSPAAETVLTFLESVGRRSEAEAYVKLFRQLPKESFALTIVGSTVVEHALSSLLEQVSFLAKLGLYTPLVVGAFEGNAGRLRATLSEELAAFRLGASWLGAEQPDLTRRVTEDLRAERIPVVHFEGGSEEGDPTDTLGRMARDLGTRKLVVVRRQGGLGPHGLTRLELGAGHQLECHSSGISLVSLRADRDALLASGQLEPLDRELLGRLERILVASEQSRTTASVTSPFNLLKELFTVKGAGTLVKLGSRIQRHEGFDTIDVVRLGMLLGSSFKRQLKPGFFDTNPASVYLEDQYRGAAIVEPLRSGPFLSKFAVEPIAQGEGLGQELWRRMTRDWNKLFWRARPDNPISHWYASVCDGFLRRGDWHVFWRGMGPGDVADLVREAVERPSDFVD